MLNAIGRAIRAGVTAVGEFATACVRSLLITPVIAIPTFLNMLIVSCVSYFIPSSLRSAIFASAPAVATIAPGVIASSMTVGLISGVPADEVSLNQRAAAAMGGATLALVSSAYTPAFALLAAPPLSFASVFATSGIASLGMSFGVELDRMFAPRVGA